jgi:DNA-directed RNA polymerase specialized sigma24 family protein
MALAKPVEAATIHEVKSAIVQLAPRQLNSLRFYAAVRIKMLGRRAHGRDHDDLLQEAIKSTVSGERPWRNKVPFFIHIRGCIRSISDGWLQKQSVDEFPETAVNDDDRRERSLDARFFSKALNQEDWDDQLDAKLFLKEVYEAFPVCTPERTFIDLWEQGYKPHEILTKLGISESAYKATVQRLRRSAILRRLIRMRAENNV